MATEIDSYVAENYDAIVADESRNVSYEDIATNAESREDRQLAAWARERAQASGKDVKPTRAKAAPKSKRAEDAGE